ncbi:hypothetical protein FCIRC_7685 [Fusarium circinatum]|uniref:Uncharacterized protein n=1 Tax=Fusarium circinatum TaxID=48490 RepID=A0A8H5TLV9_FUSCI|nr:hypothetical protein FCIRC_7685 [Fusarium circinatum]
MIKSQDLFLSKISSIFTIALNNELNNKAGGASNNSIENVFYINFKPDTKSLNDFWLKRLENATENLELHIRFFSSKAVQTLDDVVAQGNISDKDEIKKASYLAKVMNSLASKAPWIGATAENTQEKRFTTKKEELHKALISHFTEGLKLPSNILDKLEGFLTKVQNTIKNSPTSSNNTILIYIHVVIYVKDEVLQEWRPYIRTISFKPSEDLSTYVKEKNTMSSGNEVDIFIRYIQLDGAFNTDLFERSAKPALNHSPELFTTVKTLDIAVNSI